MTFVFSGIPVEVNKKNIKNMLLYVKPPDGKVSVSAPLAMSNEEIERFVNNRIDWIKEKKNKFNAHFRQSKREYVSGETLYVWGKQYCLQIMYGKRYSLALSDDKAIFTVKKESTVAQREKFIREWYREQLKEEVTRLLPKWEKITGLKCNTWQTKNMKTRWGTCKPKAKKIWFSLRLAQKNPECLEYIILHELMHFLEKNHGDRFKSLLFKYMPTWKKIRSKLVE